MLLIDDRLIDSMRLFVMATNRLDNLRERGSHDLALLERLAEERRAAGVALQEALLQHGWRRPGL